ncbi:MAG: NUDIX hydrolase [Silicimonas sp.]|nr:NUDIX hydrolase [Silicimonas sp.]
MVSALPDSDVPIRDAATVILVRDADTSPAVLMGQRGKTAVFMPDKFVFPGGAVDDDDDDVPLASVISAPCRDRLVQRSGRTAEALAAAAIREVWEETGLRLGRTSDWRAPGGWEHFGATGLAPDAAPLRFFFRAVTPPGRPRRFDARFFLADAATLDGDPEDFSDAEDELCHLHWVRLDEVRRLSLPFITQIVLGELVRHLPRLDAPDRVPFITNDVLDETVVWL